MRKRILLGALSTALVACAPTKPVPSASPPLPLSAHISRVDQRTGLPTFAWVRASGTRYTDAKTAALATITSVSPSFKLSPTTQASLELQTIHDVGTGPIIASFQQRAAGMEIFRAGLRVLLSRSFEPIAASGFVVPGLAGATQAFVLDENAAVTRALQVLGETASFQSISTAGLYARFDAPTFSQPARVRRVLFPLDGGGVEPGLYVEVMLRHGRARSFVISGKDGRVLFSNDLTRYDAYSYRVYADPVTLLPYDGPSGNVVEPTPSDHPEGLHPPFVPPQLVTLANYPFSYNDPWLPPGATVTTGNNVSAYSDVSAPDGFSGPPDQRPPITSAGVFDYTYDTTISPGVGPTNVLASTTHLFYVMNFMHDWFYDSGFNEISGNHQQSNFGRGGVEGDPLHAESQDYSGTNNSNTQVPADGGSPIVQMFIFSGTSQADITVTAPASIAGVKAAAIAGFGTDSFDLTGTVVLGVDGVGPDVNDGCEALTNADATGKIVLLHRGTCSFLQKVQNAQTAGAAAAIVDNVAGSVQPDVPPFMAGTSTAINIPSLSLDQADGAAVESNIGAGVTLTLRRTLDIDLDGALDTNVVSHEWGHIMSGRLIGDGNGLTTNQSGGLSEGWSDFVAMLVSVRADDLQKPLGANWMGAYPLGTYAESGQTDYYFGIRRVPYSVDFTKDPLTFKDIQDGTPITGAPLSFGADGSSNSEVHSTGEIWTTMLLECYVALLRASPSFQIAQAKMKLYIVASYKMTPIDPTFLEARDALLSVALASDANDFQLFAEAFARRGAGVGAIGPPKDSANNVGVVESFVTGNDVELSSVVLNDDVISCDHDGLIDEDEHGTIDVTVRNSGTTPLTQTQIQATSTTEGVIFDNGGVVSVPTLQPFDSTMVKIGVAIAGPMSGANILIDVAAIDPSLAFPRAIQVALPTRYDADEAADSSFTDNVDTSGTSWDPEGEGGPTWARVYEGDDGWWQVADTAIPSDETLTSEAFQITNPSFTLSFKHRWSFRYSTRRMVDLDGGVVELSTDGGSTWDDASTFGTADYNTTLATGTANPLTGQPAYGHTSPDYPNTWVQSSITMTLPTQPDSVMVRFHMGTGGSISGAPGWEVDDIALAGASTMPFWSFIPDRRGCDPNAPTADAGPTQSSHPRYKAHLHGMATVEKGKTPHFHWKQTGGTPVTLDNAESQTPMFVTPADDGTLSFELRVDDGALLSPPASTTITLSPSDGCSMASDPSTWWPSLLVLAISLCLRRRRHALR